MFMNTFNFSMHKSVFLLNFFDSEHRSLGEFVHLVLFDLHLIVTDLGSSIRFWKTEVDIAEVGSPV